ncbi:MAG: VWA domain-containing protein [Planctomycetes bacterium]|nr:VWA domain-containing protein [Planctomycetota bacterium]NOG55558.1 VWA domain-containing protein [Planctomycetota bacterium]
MTFLHGTIAMAGLIGVLAPIIIHLLFRKRRRPVPWAAMKFLLAAYQRMKRRTRLEQWLLLLARCCIVLLLGAALARPLLQSTPIASSMLEGGRIVYLLLDNGVASGNRGSLTVGPDHTALQNHIANAQNIIASLGPGDRVSVIRMARPASFLIDPPAIDHRAVSSRLETISPSDAATDVPGALELLSARLEEDARTDRRPAVVMLLSEWLAGSAQTNRPLQTLSQLDLSDHVTFLATAPNTAVSQNTQITALRPTRRVFTRGLGESVPSVQVQLRRNGGDLPGMITTVSIKSEQSILSQPISVSWEQGQTDQSVDIPIDTVNLLDQRSDTTGPINLSANLDDDALSADNHRSLIVEVQDGIHVVVIARREAVATGPDAGRLDLYPAASWIRRALNPAADVRMQIDDIDPASVTDAELRGADAVFLTRPDLLSEAAWQSLARYVHGSTTANVNATHRAGLLWLFPADSEQRAALWTDDAVQALDLPWTWPREIEKTIEADGWRLADQQPKSVLLSMIQSELDTLAPTIQIHKRLAPEAGFEPGDIILEMEDGRPYLLTYRPRAQGGGLVVYQSAAARLDWTSLPAKPLMVALTQEVLRQGMSLARAVPETMAGDRPVFMFPATVNTLVGPDDTRVSLRPFDENESPTAGQQVPRIADAIQQAGMYRAYSYDEAPLSTSPILVHVDSSGCNTTPQTTTQIETWLQETGEQWAFISPEQLQAASTSLWKSNTNRSDYSFAALCALFLLLGLETLMARKFSHADSTTQQQGLQFHGIGDLSSRAGSEAPSSQRQ